MKASSALIAVIMLLVYALHAADAPKRQADRELLGRLFATVTPRIEVHEVPLERAIIRYLELVAAEWKATKPIPYRVERRKRQPQQPPLPADPGETVTFSFAARPFVDGLRELIALADWSFTVRDGTIIFANTPDLYRDEIWQRPILLPK